MKLKNLLLAQLAVVLVAGYSMTISAEEGFTVTGGISVTDFAGDRGLGLDDDTEESGFAAFGYRFDNPWELEVSYSRLDEAETDSGDIDVEQIRLDALYNFTRNGDWQPYLVFGIGEQDFDFDNADDIDETAANAGVGVKYFLSEKVAVRSDLRAIASLDESEVDTALSIGLSYLFGSKKPKPAPVAPAPAPQAAPEPAKDSDGDGVIDQNDRCPDTKAGARVDEDGCYILIKETHTINLQVNFANNSDVVPEAYIKDIREVADFMKAYPLTEVVLEGHTDSRGKEDYNADLSDRRAKAVAAVLVDKLNVPGSRVSARGYGESKPVASNDTAEGRAENRRVAAVISATEEKITE